MRELNSHGKENFLREIIDIARSQEELNELEIKYINMYDAINSDSFYNLTGGGKTRNTYESKTYEEMLIIKEKIRLSKIGKNNPMYGKTKENCPFYGKHHTEETKSKLRYPKSEYVKKALRESNLGGNNHGARKVICITTGKIFYTIKDAGDYYNVDKSSISKCCRGKISYAGKTNGMKLIWKYYSDILY